MSRSHGLWLESAVEQVPQTAVPDAVDVDLAIVGGGFTGCSAALWAAEHGASACVLEARTIGHGGSGRNVGLVNAGLWLPPDDILSALGEDEGSRLLGELGKAPSAVFSLIERYGISCEATRKGTLHLAHAPRGLAELQTRLRQQNRLGVPVRLLDQAETAARTGASCFFGSLFDPRAGTVQPLSYVRGLARAAAAAGAIIAEHAPVEKIEREASSWRVTTPRCRVRAKSLLLATNAYHLAAGDVPAPQFVPVNYFQVATEPLGAAARARVLPGGEGCWDTATVMSSLRLDAAGRLLMGGIGDLGGVGGSVHRAWAKRKIKSVFNGLDVPEIAYGWSGRIAMTGDHIPKVVAAGPSAYAVFGYSGRGIGPGTVFGLRAAEALLCDAPDRLPISPVPAHRESITALRGAALEAGAVLAHAAAARS